MFKSLLIVSFVAAALPCAVAPAYRFPEPRPFSGPALWNPYAHTTGRWQRTNLHAHGRVWRGITNGQQTDAAVVEAYQRRGYDVAGISDYQRIAAHHGVATLPLYEHGYNIAKAHQLAIGAHAVEWLDFPLWQSLNQKQFLLNRIARTTDLVAINHPDTAYTQRDLQSLTGYQLIEVVNGPFAYEREWDAALSSGHVVWAIGDDDNHDVTNAARFGVAYSMIDARSSNASDIVPALREGRAYAVALESTPPDATLVSVRVQDSTLTVSIMGTPATLVFVGQNGVVRRTLERTTEATYRVDPLDAYIRTVIRTPHMTMYLNPIIRYDGSSLPVPMATVDAALSWLRRLFVGTACLAVVWSTRRRLTT